MSNPGEDTSKDFNCWINTAKSFSKFDGDTGNLGLHFMKEYDPTVVFPSNDNAQDLVMTKDGSYTVDVRMWVMGTFKNVGE